MAIINSEKISNADIQVLTSEIKNIYSYIICYLFSANYQFYRHLQKSLKFQPGKFFTHKIIKSNIFKVPVSNFLISKSVKCNLLM